jgi:lysine 2,3-aminomutase
VDTGRDRRLVATVAATARPVHILKTMTNAKTLRSPAALAQAGLIAPERLGALERVAARYAIAITPASLALIDPNAPDDPIARQFLPDEAELEASPGETADPIGDAVHSPVEGVVHRYPDRALLMLTHTCATYCRFCFRRESVGAPGSGTLSRTALRKALAYIASQPQIWEVILTGGDPLVLSPRRLGALMRDLARIKHCKVVRIHTRVPAVDPARITDELAAALRCAGKAVYIALHVNHPRELTPAVTAACGRLIDAGLPMVSQTVLLRGVNDDPEVLGSLMRSLVENRIKPYYLHHGDYAPGTAHLRTSVEDGQTLMRALRGRLSGLCQPTFVLDIPGGHGKVPIGPAYLTGDDGGLWVEDPWGAKRPYPPSGSQADSRK